MKCICFCTHLHENAKKRKKKTKTQKNENSKERKKNENAKNEKKRKRIFSRTKTLFSRTKTQKNENEDANSRRRCQLSSGEYCSGRGTWWYTTYVLMDGPPIRSLFAFSNFLIKESPAFRSNIIDIKIVLTYLPVNAWCTLYFSSLVTYCFDVPLKYYKWKHNNCPKGPWRHDWLLCKKMNPKCEGKMFTKTLRLVAFNRFNRFILI